MKLNDDQALAIWAFMCGVNSKEAEEEENVDAVMVTENLGCQFCKESLR